MIVLTLREPPGLPMLTCTSSRRLTAVSATCNFTLPLPIVSVTFLFAFALLVVLVGSMAVTDVVVDVSDTMSGLERSVLTGVFPSCRWP
jgi:hypothetical protein